MVELRAGSATVDITPDEPVPLGGYPTELPSPAFKTGPQDNEIGAINDKITVNALVIDDGQTRVGLVSMDLLNAFREFTTHVEETLIERNIEFDELVLAGTHTHNAPYMPGKLLRVNPMVGNYRDISHVTEIETAVANALCVASENLSPATFRVGHARNGISVVNRRDPESDVDPELTVLHVESENAGETAVVNYACHPLCLSGDVNAVSADWPGVMRRTIADQLTEPTVLFFNGAAGDVNPRSLVETDADSRQKIHSQYDDEFEFVDAVGREIAKTATDAIEDAKENDPLDAQTVTTESRELQLSVTDLPDRESALETYRTASDDIRRYMNKGDKEAAFDRRWDRLYIQETLELLDAGFKRVPATMQYIGLGNVGLLSLPGEAFVRHGLEFKTAADADTLLLAGYANEYVGYLPTLDQFDDGGYEVRTCKLSADAIRTFKRAGKELVIRE